MVFHLRLELSPGAKVPIIAPRAPAAGAVEGKALALRKKKWPVFVGSST